MTRAEFARHRGVSKPAVTQWAAAGRLVLTADGKVDVEASEVRLAETMNSRGGKRQTGVSGGAQAEPAPGRSGELQFASGTLTDARTKQAQTRAKLDDLEYQERIGRLVEKAKVDAAIADGLATIVSQLRTISVRTAPKLVGEADLRKIQDAIDDEVERICQETSDTLRAMIAGAVVSRQ